MTRMSSRCAAFATALSLFALPALLALPAHAADSGFDIEEKPTAPVVPQSNNWITLGGQYNTDRSYYLGRFSGAVDPGFYGLGAFHYGQRDAWDSGGTHYIEIQGDNLGLWSRTFSARIGQQGTWGLGFSYDGVPYYATDDFKSVFNPNGTLVPGVSPGQLRLAPGATWPKILNAGRFNGVQFPGTTNSFLPQAAATPALAAPLSVLLRNYDVSTRRDIFTGNGKYQWEDWTITSSWRHEHKTGFYANSAVIAGGAPAVIATSTTLAATAGGAAYFVQPVDYDTDRFDLTAALSRQRYQIQVGYMFSNFKDNNSVLNLANPFGFPTSAGTGGTNNAASLFAPYSLPPSNSAHQIKVMLGYNFTPTTRLNANFAYGVQMQNDPYVTATGDPANQALANSLYPRSSFNGLVKTIYGNVALTAEPLPKLDLRLAYTIDDRDNQSPRNAYFVVQRSDLTSDCPTAGGVAATARCYNLPFSYRKQTATAEVGYRIMPQTKVTLSDTFATTWRNYSDTSQVYSNTVTAKVRSAVTDDIFGSLSFSHQDRTAHNYNNMGWWQAISGPNTPNQTELRSLLMYFEASRKHDEVKGMLDWSPLNNLTATLMVKFSHDKYPDGADGMRNNHNLVIGPDVSWQPNPALSVHAYYEYQQLFYEQSSIYQNSNVTPTTTGTGFIVPWTAKTTDSVHTLGVSIDWHAIKDVLKFTFDYNFSYGDTAYMLGDGGALFGPALTNSQTFANATMQPLPDVTSMLNMVTLRGEYTFRPNITFLFGYAFEKFTYKDFMNGTAATQYANFLLPGTVNPNDTVHVLYGAVRVRF